MAFRVFETLTFFRKQSFQIRLPFRSRGKAPTPRVSASTGGVYRVCIARGRVRGCEIGPPGNTAGSRVTGGRGSGNRCCCCPMLWRHIRVVRPRCAVPSDRSGGVRVRRVRSRRLSVCCWRVSVGVGTRLTRVVVRHDARQATPIARHAIDLSATPLRPTQLRRFAPRQKRPVADERIGQNLFHKTRWSCGKRSPNTHVNKRLIGSHWNLHSGPSGVRLRMVGCPLYPGPVAFETYRTYPCHGSRAVGSYMRGTVSTLEPMVLRGSRHACHCHTPLDKFSGCAR